MSSSTLALIQSAFGISSTLYTVLQCNKSSTSIELKKSYRKAALKYHPDRCVESSNSNDDSVSCTLKFQAVSAAYQVLSNKKRRSVYDSTGQIIDDEDEYDTSHTNNDDCPNNNSHQHQQQHWEEFFNSIFNEIITKGSNHATSASSFRGSKEEQRDVLHYYTMCKGDMNKVVECIIHGSIDDVDRYTNDIIEPAVVRGDVEDYSGIRNNLRKVQKKKRRRILEDSSSSEDEQRITNKKKTAGKSKSKEHNTLLIDTDDESDTAPSTKKRPSSVTADHNMSMSKKDKLNFRVAKKRKAKAEKEIEISSIINSKNWDASSALHHASSQQQSRKKKKKNMGDLSDALLDNIEKKYGGGGKKPPKKRR